MRFGELSGGVGQQSVEYIVEFSSVLLLIFAGLHLEPQLLGLLVEQLRIVLVFEVEREFVVFIGSYQ